MDKPFLYPALYRVGDQNYSVSREYSWFAGANSSNPCWQEGGAQLEMMFIQESILENLSKMSWIKAKVSSLNKALIMRF